MNDWLDAIEDMVEMVPELKAEMSEWQAGAPDFENRLMTQILREVLSSDVAKRTVSGGETPTATLVKLQKMKVKMLEKSPIAQETIGLLHSAANYQMPKINVSKTLVEIICAAGLKGVDLSEGLNPNMNRYQVAKWQSRLYEAVNKNPDTIFFITCDSITPIEAIMYLDDELKVAAMAAFVKYQGDAQGIAWRGEDYVRIAGVHAFPHPVLSLTQQMKALTDPEQECVICMEVINDDKTVDSIVTGRAQFTCMHNICRLCFEKNTLYSCPVCRSTDSLQVALNKIGTSGKSKKKARAAARHNR